MPPVPLTVGQRLRAIVSGSIGNLVEWYDWYVYTAFSLYFSSAFFPTGDRTAQLLNTAALFAVGPVFLVGLDAHVRHRRQRMTGRRSSMPKNSRVCMLEISALSWNRRKCETPSSG